MTFVIPAANNAHNVDRATNARFLANINSPTNTGTKAAGSLPITGVATEYDNNSAGSTKGVGYEFQASQATWDVSAETKLMVWHHQFNAPNRIQVDTKANAGVAVRIYSGTGSMPTNYREFELGGNDTPFANAIKGHVPYVIDLNATNHDSSSGTFDNTGVTSYAILTTRANIAGTSTNWNYYTPLYIFDTIKTSAATPTFSGSGANPTDAVSLVQGSTFTNKIGNWVRQVGNSVVFIDVGFRIGDNSTATTFNDNGLTIVSPPSNDSTDPRYRLTNQACRVYIYLRNNAADVATFSGTWKWGTKAAFDFGQSDSAVITFNSPTFRGMGDFEIGSSVSGAATFDDVGVVNLSDTGDLDGSTFRNPSGTYALSVGQS